MRILFIAHEDSLNGASKSMLNIIDCLLEKKHEIYIVSSYNSGDFYNESKKRHVKILIMPFVRWSNVLPDGLALTKLKVKWVIKYKIVNIKSAKAIAKIALKNKIDIIHSNTSVINIGALISKYSGIPHVWHLREFGDLDFNMHFYEPLWYVSKFMNKYTDRFICISKAIMEHYPYLESNKKTLVYNGISNDAIIEENAKMPHLGVHILIAGRISETKGQHEAVAACELLLRRGFNDFELFMAGNGDISFNIGNCLKEKIHILGQVDNMREVRKHIDIELVCSKAEAFGRVTAEAMLAGIPVIGSNTGGTPELINDGVDGFLYNRGDIEMLANKIEMLIKDKELIKQMGIAAQKKAKKMFTIQRCVEEIEAVYRSCIR